MRAERLRLVGGCTALILAMAPAGTALADPAAGSTASLSAGVATPVIVFLKDQPAVSPASVRSAGRRDTIAASQAPFLRELAQVRATHVTTYSLINAFAATVPAGEEQALAADPTVAQVIPDGIIEGPSTWTVKKAFLNKGWLTCKPHGVDCKTSPLDDYAVVVLNPKNGKGVGDLTGADGWAVNQPKTIDRVTIAGIPSTSPGTLVTTINTRTVTESGEPYRQAATPGFTDGTSGGPWLRDFSTKTNRGVLIGDTGGFEQGGPSSGTPSYANDWTGSFAALVKAAVSFEG